MNESDLDALADEPMTGIQETLGYRLVEWEDGRAVVELTVDKRHLNRSGVLHGGVIATLLDSALGYCGQYCPYPGRIRRGLTLSLTTSFTGQVSGGVIRVVGVRRAGGRRIYTATGEVTGPDGAVIALGEGTFRLRSGSEDPEGVPL